MAYTQSSGTHNHLYAVGINRDLWSVETEVWGVLNFCGGVFLEGENDCDDHPPFYTTQQEEYNTTGGQASPERGIVSRGSVQPNTYAQGLVNGPGKVSGKPDNICVSNCGEFRNTHRLLIR